MSEETGSVEIQPSMEVVPETVGTEQTDATQPSEATPQPTTPETSKRPDNVPYSRFQEVIRERNEMRNRLQEMAQPAREQVKNGVSEAPPDPRQYETQDAYFHAVNQWADQRAEQRAQQMATQTGAQHELRSIADRFNSGIEKMATSNPEIGQAVQFFASFEGSNPALFREIVADENGPAIALEIANDPEWGEKLFAASPVQAGRMIANRIQSTNSTTSTKPPLPVTKTVTGTASAAKDPSKMSREEYFAWREKQER